MSNSNNNDRDNKLIAWCQKTSSGIKITISDSKKHALKLFTPQTDEASDLSGAIYYGVIEKTDINGTFIKAGEQNLYARFRKSDRVGKTGLWQVQKEGVSHKLPRCRRHFHLENYYYSTQQQAENDTELKLKPTGIDIDAIHLKSHENALLADIKWLNTHPHHKGLVRLAPSILQQALTYPITSIVAADNISKLSIAHQLNDLPINISIDEEAKHMIAQAEAICDDDIIDTKETVLIYQHTQTCHLIDINSAYSNQSPKQINLALLKDLWQLIYLKNLSGIIVIDFISMESKNDRQMLHYAMIKQVKKISKLLQKPAPMIHGFTQAGLYEITVSAYD